jgi:hypothetical protein
MYFTTYLTANEQILFKKKKRQSILHHCTGDEAIELLEKDFVDWMDFAMK